ncbi:MAG TPA: cytochrome c oxidase subunit II [Pyrinomonadaceae bacterium]|jgi:cytochrome c oxidase subunit 2
MNIRARNDGGGDRRPARLAGDERLARLARRAFASLLRDARNARTHRVLVAPVSRRLRALASRTLLSQGSRAVLISSGAFAAACRGSQSALNPAGPHASSVSRLWWLMFYVSAGVYVVVMAFLAAALVRKRQRGRETSDAPDTTPDAARERRMRGVVIGGVAATIAILFIFLIATFIATRSIYALADPNNLRIKVRGQQWWWEVEYENDVASQTFKTANEIHIPVGRPVTIRLTSSDVIHSFWVPNLGGKRDLVPGHETTVWLKADHAGTYRGQCAEYCGLQHAHMAFVVVAEPVEQFEAWAEAQRRPAAPPATAEQQRGQQVFLNAPCVMCHTVRGTGAGGAVAPDLTHLASRQTIAAGMLPNTRGHLGGWISNSQELKPGNRMPPNPLPPQDLQALLSYLESLK